MKCLTSLQSGLLLIVVAIAAVYSSLSLYLQSRQHHISIRFEACTQAARLGNCARSKTSQGATLHYATSEPLIAAASLSCLSAAPAATDPQPEPFSLADYVKDRPPRLQQVASHLSSHQAGLQATLIVSFTLPRLARQLEPICANWPGPISTAVYLPTVADTAEENTQKAREYLFDVHSRLEALGSCQADIFMMSEDLADPTLGDLFPINTLRNVALLAARTELVLIGDGDFLMSQTLIDELASSSGYRRLHQLCEDGNFVVVPAFDVLLDRTQGAENTAKALQLEQALSKAQAIVQKSKTEVLQALPEGWLAPFGFWRNFTHGHGPTDFTRWAGAQAAYEAKYAWQYEPWGLMERHQTPLFDERFRGYGFNKAVWTRWVAALGHKFMVHPNAFMVHQPHAESCAKALWRSSMPAGHPEKRNPRYVVSEDAACKPSSDSHLFLETQRQGFKVRAEIAEGIYKPTLSAMTKRCKATLPWC